ncbi:MAG: hypothetical protein JNK05_37460 [Myxococcales bacterium]|nr:hypothetical protein [Myxococcales bacterium]
MKRAYASSFAAIAATSALCLSRTTLAQSSEPQSSEPLTIDGAAPADTSSTSAPGETAPPSANPPAQQRSLVLAPMIVPTIRPSYLRADSEGIRVEPRGLTPSERDAIIARTRALRLTIGGLAGFGGLVLGTGLTVLIATVPPLACGISCGGIGAISAGLGLTFGVATTFLAPAAFVFGASRQGVRGSYWATFGGFWLGLIGGSLLTGASVFGGLGLLQATATISVFLPVVGMAIGHELSATAVREGEQTAPIAGISQGFPFVALGDRSASAGWIAQF